MKKVVVNNCYGGFGLSKEAQDFIAKEIDFNNPNFNDHDFRENPKLVECVETLGERANAEYSDLIVVEIPDNAEWDIDDYDGMEEINYNCRIDVDKLMSLKTKDEVVKYLDENEILHN